MNDRVTVESDSYLTLDGPCQAVLKVLGSKFSAFARPVRSRDEALEFWKGLKKEFHDATHHCMAYRLNGSPGESRYNDDGEPSGSAGKPILAAMERAGLHDVALVVVRYFGGTKLGIGGLARAYGAVAAGAISQGKVSRRFITETFTVSFPHPLTSPVMRTTVENGAAVVGTTYDEKVHLRVVVRTSRASELIAALREATNGGVQIETGPQLPEVPPDASERETKS